MLEDELLALLEDERELCSRMSFARGAGVTRASRCRAKR